jgi:hypothetical protein
MNIEQLYNENKDMIKKMSSTIAMLTHIERNEIEAQGNLIFCECAKKYDQEKGNFSAYLSNALYFSLYRYACNVADDRDYHSIDTESSYFYHDISWSEISEKIEIKLSYTPDYTDIIEATFANLSNDARYITDIILTNKINKKHKIYKTSVNTTDIQKYLLSENWNRARIRQAFYNIRAFYNIQACL